MTICITKTTEYEVQEIAQKYSRLSILGNPYDTTKKGITSYISKVFIMVVSKLKIKQHDTWPRHNLTPPVWCGYNIPRI